METPKKSHIFQDLLIIAVSVFFAYILIRTQAIHSIIATTQDFEFLGSFVAGLFFTSVFTTAPAIVALGEMSQASSIITVAFFGAFGAVIGDVVMFKFIRDRFSGHLMELLHLKKKGKKIKIRHHLYLFRWASFFVGGLIIASPLPDELGISFLGFSKMNLRMFVPVSFIFNFIGILLIGMVANAL